MSMNIHAKKGDKVRYNGINGSDSDKKFAFNRGLIVGKEYTVEHLYPEGPIVGLVIMEDNICVFNSVMFDDVEQTLEEQVNDCNEQTDTFICIHEGRTLLKIDMQGFVSIDGLVVGHEPLLPKCFEVTIDNVRTAERELIIREITSKLDDLSNDPLRKIKFNRVDLEPYIPHEIRRQLSEMESNKKGKGGVQCFTHEPTVKDSLIVEPKFDPSLPFEVSDHEGKEWHTPDNSSYVGQDKNGCHLLLIECPAGFELDEYQSFPYIRNVKNPGFKTGDPIWYKGNQYCDWAFGTFVSNLSLKANGGRVITHNGNYEIRPFFVDGVATYPPNFDQHENN